MQVKLTDLFIKKYNKLDNSVQTKADKAVNKIRENPKRFPLLSAELKDCYKIYIDRKKFRLIYTIHKEKIWLITIDKRDKIYDNKIKIIESYRLIKGNFAKKS